MRPAALLVVLVTAKLIGLFGRDLPWSFWLPSALFWDDVAVAAGVWLIERAFGKFPSGTVYWVIAVWTAINVPVVRALGSPLTPNMIGAAGDALLDSIAHYATVATAAAIGVVLAVAAVLPGLLERVAQRRRGVVAIAVLVVAIPGPVAARRLDVRGLQRNAITALFGPSRPTASPPSVVTRSGEWRVSPYPAGQSQELGFWRNAATGRNVIVIVLESTAAQYLRPYGSTDDPMPNLTVLASKAIQFERAYAVYPESIKGLFAFLCSRSPAFEADAEAHARASCDPLAGEFSAAGYRTALFHSGRFGYLGMDAIVRRQRFDTLEDAATIGGIVESSFGVDEPSTVARMLAWIDGLRTGSRFFITYLPAAGHHPYATTDPGPFSGPGEITAYRNALHEGDRSLGTFLAGLRARGLDDRTMFVVFGDHGEAFGQHDGNFGHTFQIFDENVRVPLLVAIPGVTNARVGVSKVASIIDIAPTILEFVGLPQPVSYEGEVLIQSQARMAFFLTDYSLGLLGLQDGCWKFHLDVESTRSRLFDTCRDPGEQVDLSSSHADRIDIYAERLRAWSTTTRDRLLTEK